MKVKLGITDVGILMGIRKDAKKLAMRTGNEDIRELTRMITSLTDLFMEAD